MLLILKIQNPPSLLKMSVSGAESATEYFYQWSKPKNVTQNLCYKYVSC